MPYVELRDGESGDELLRRFNAQVTKAGILREIKDRRFFRTKREKARIAAQRAARRRRRQRR
ncbi:MAG: ribosomal protein [Dehalococcoidia bacterium]|jgi:small subunit ribosomal protein S21|nr:ribosomal protein [Dehalococcoidia bacterium]